MDEPVDRKSQDGVRCRPVPKPLTVLSETGLQLDARMAQENVPVGDGESARVRPVAFPTEQDQDPVGDNPFLAEDQRHTAWENATRKAHELLSDFTSRITELLPTDPESRRIWAVEYTSARFDLWAWRTLAVVWDENAFRHYERWLCQYATATYQCSQQSRLQGVDPDAVLAAIHLRLIQRIEFWKKEARTYLQAVQAASRKPFRPRSPRGVLNGRLIAKWMDDEGYTNDMLAKKLGVKPRVVSSILNNGKYHGRPAIIKLANAMGLDDEAALYVE